MRLQEMLEDFKKKLEECNNILKECHENYKNYWLNKLSKHGYFLIEEDDIGENWKETLPDDPLLEGITEGLYRINRKLVFWKEKELDGIVITDWEFKSEYNDLSYETRFYTIGPAYNYFNELYKNKKESLIKKLIRFGRKKELDRVDSGILGRMNINGKEYNAAWILSYKEFRKLLKN